jgi:hypothetical protein
MKSEKGSASESVVRLANHLEGIDADVCAELTATACCGEGWRWRGSGAEREEERTILYIGTLTRRVKPTVIKRPEPLELLVMWTAACDGAAVE